ncbi:MAG: hypothetical protein Q8O89_09015 [Nanoarchaeota archaeon]|nr:hypothetical protein [Nanoarchaeota archaeon]
MKKVKKRLTRAEEFEIMKLVLDKFLWAGFLIMGVGFYKMVSEDVTTGLSWMIAGALLLALFIVMVVREYEVFTS